MRCQLLAFALSLVGWPGADRFGKFGDGVGYVVCWTTVGAAAALLQFRIGLGGPWRLAIADVALALVASRIGIAVGFAVRSAARFIHQVVLRPQA